MTKGLNLNIANSVWNVAKENENSVNEEIPNGNPNTEGHLKFTEW